MKNLMFAFFVFTFTLSLKAQNTKMSPPKNLILPTATAVDVNATQNQNEVTAFLGMASAALNISATYVKPFEDFGVGGYLFFQTAKEKDQTTLVSGLTSLGAILKVNFVNSRHILAYVAPGFGFSILKDASTSSTGKKSDENQIGPVFKLGVQYKLSLKSLIGLERMQFSNWLNDQAHSFVGPSEYYMVATTFLF